ncbi:protein LNK1 isoform X2 [Malania oleifera]|uniref:protein LNK1 isoform X2 n=1 Tax=Malania oleifera TaxID=397392 RepID=UPI0025AE8B61|nr:protein LNK1 isoform X2 [Malania oleifera]
MSDLCMYELEDIAWDDFGVSDDHIVPHPGNEPEKECTIRINSRKKPRQEVVGITTNIEARHAAQFVSPDKEKTSLLTPKNRKDTMLEKGSWSHSSDGFPASCDGDPRKDVNVLASDDSGMSSCFRASNVDSGATDLCDNDPVRDSGTTVDNSMYHYPLSHISQTDNDLSFFDNDQGDKESSDLLYYGWPDIGNFEDVDRIFRSCDSTFGLGSVNNEDELSWFSSSNAIEGSEDVKPGFKFSSPESSALGSVSEYHEAPRLNNPSPSLDGCDKSNVSIKFKTNSCTSDPNQHAALCSLSFMNGSNTISDTKDCFMPKEQINLHKKQSKRQNSSEGKRKDKYLENGCSINHCSNLKPLAHIPHMHSNYIYPLDQMASGPTLSVSKSENNAFSSRSRKAASYASNQVQTQESSHGPSFEASVMAGHLKTDKPYSQSGLQASLNSNLEHVDLGAQAAFCDPLSVQKPLLNCETEVEGHSEVGGANIGVPAELDCSNVQESSCISSLDEISLEATSFRQLQHVMEQLDIRTKLCIRDSLYRLARSAEQRHNCANLNGGIREDGDTSGALMAEEATKCPGLIDMETDTNPIDRSIAHLLFHRPSDPSLAPANDALGHKSHTLMHGSITSPPVLAEKLVCNDRTTAGGGGDQTLLITDDKKQ